MTYLLKCFAQHFCLGFLSKAKGSSGAKRKEAGIKAGSRWFSWAAFADKNPNYLWPS